MSFRRPPPPQEYFDRVAENARKKREGQALAENVSPVSLGRCLGLPIAAAQYILKLQARIEALEAKLAALEGPPHLSVVEKR